MCENDKMIQLEDSVLNTLRNWKENEPSKGLDLFLGIDIGATNTRVAIVNGATSDSYLEIAKFQCHSAVHLYQTFQEIGSQMFEILKTRPSSVCLDAAGPIEQGLKVSITNYELDHRVIEVAKLPDILFPHNKTVIVNDLESACEGIAALNSENRLQEYFEPLWGSPNPALQPVNYLVLAMGTGLGTGLLVSKKGKHKVQALEGGHTFINRLGMKHPEYEQETKIIDYISNKLYNGLYTLEYEDFCSGRGLSYIYEALTSQHLGAVKSLQPEEIILLAPSDELAFQAVLYHYKYLMRNAQTLCVCLQAKGVFLAGDNQVKNDALVTRMVNELKAEFVNHSKREWVEGVPVYRQVKPYNLNLHGCLYVAKRLSTKM